jgi:hypothetical protein
VLFGWDGIGWDGVGWAMIVLVVEWYVDRLCHRDALLFIMVNIVDGDHFVRQKLVCAVVELCCGEVLHDWLRLHVQVPTHGIAMPPPKYLDKVEVDLATNQRHGTTNA